MKFPRIAVACALSVFSLAPFAAAAAPSVTTWTVDGVPRQALVFAPQTDAAGQKHPLIFAFHGHGGNMQNAARDGLQDLWPEAVVVYPQGLPTKTLRDQSGSYSGWQFGAGDNGDRDLKLFDAMLADLKTKYAIDDARVYATGFSNGAVFTYLLWAQRGSKLAAVGPCAGIITDANRPGTPKPAIIIGGQSDQLLLFSVQEQTMETVRKLNGDKADLVTRIHPGGHVYPPWAGQAIVDFFKAHTL